MAKNPHLDELGQFLRARRAEVTLDAVGLPSRKGVRRVAGLRREEVAQAVQISPDYYTRIEQGRLAPSASVLGALADVLNLTPDERLYAEGLARAVGRRTPPQRRHTVIRAPLRRLLEQLTDVPAFIVGQYLDILAWNPLANELLGDLDRLTARERNAVRLVFTDSRTQALYEDWEAMARSNVAILRLRAADHPDDPRLAALVGELSLVSPEFRQWWADRRVASPEFGNKTIRHPEFGDFTFDWDSFTAAGHLDQHLTLWTVEPGSSTDKKLQILKARLAEQRAFVGR